MKNRKITALIVSLLLVLVLGAGATVAYIFTKTDAKQNTFTPAVVSCEVTEKFDGSTKSDVKIKNTGNTEVYIRAKIVVSWAKDNVGDEQTVSAIVPQEKTDYVISFGDKNWIKGSDGYFYFQNPVAVNGETDALISSCALAENANVPEGYHLSVEIIASALQSTPAEVAATTWGLTLENGRIVKG